MRGGRLGAGQIDYPTDGAVFGTITVKATKTDPNDGWVAIRSPRPTRSSGHTYRRSRLEWNTAVRGDKAQRLYPDGDYTACEAVSYDGSGKQQNWPPSPIHVKNAIDATVFGQSVVLRTNYTRARTCSCMR